MKKYLVLVLSLMCVSCADLDTQMAGLKKAMNGDSNQQSQSATAPNKVNNQSPQKNSSPSKSGNVNNVANESGSLNLKEAQVAFDCGIFIVGAKDDRLGVHQRTGATLPVKVLNYDAAKKVYEFNILGAPSFGPKLADSYKLNVNNKTLESVYNQPSNEPRPPRISNCNSLKTQNTQVPKDDRASEPDWVSKMKQDMENSKTPKQKEIESTRQKYTDLLSSADSAYRCGPSTFIISNNKVTFLDYMDKDISNQFTDVRIEKSLVYYTVNVPKLGPTKSVLDTNEKKTITLVNGISFDPNKSNQFTMDSPCKKIK